MIGLSLLAAAAAMYTPAGKWTLDYQQDLCLLTRPFSAGGTKATLGFRQAPADSQTEVIVLFADDPDSRLRRGFVIMKVGGLPVSTLSGAVSERVPGGHQRLLRFIAARDQVAALATAPDVTIEVIGEQPLTFSLERGSAALGALQTCENDQVASWGIDLSAVAKPAKAIDPAKWLRFPLEAAANRRAGETTVRWTIDVTGRVSDCVVVRTSGTPILDKAACTQVLQHGLYEPAIGKDGKPTPWIETRRILWALG
ncbi:MAG: energy transducer TonB [Alphaproteobacteria bacterium]|nr:MAG: energy transducer TonB [Alphaproteobacteria bacterium]